MRHETNLVVIGHSLREDCRPVVDTGLRIAEALGGQAELVHAYAPLRTLLRVPRAAQDLRSWKQAQEALGESLHQEAEHLGLGVHHKVGWHVEAGPPHEVLNNVAASLDADLLVVGPGTRGRLAVGALGSTTDRLLRTAVRPVLVARGSLTVPPQRVLAAIDLSRHSVLAYRCAQFMLRDMGCEEPAIEIVTVLDSHELQRPLSDEQLDAFVAEELERLVLDYAPPKTGHPSFRVRRGDARDELVREVKDYGADLLVVGAHGRSRSDPMSELDRQMIGRVAHELARSASCSVLVVPPACSWAAEVGPGSGRWREAGSVVGTTGFSDDRKESDHDRHT